MSVSELKKLFGNTGPVKPNFTIPKRKPKEVTIQEENPVKTVNENGISEAKTNGHLNGESQSLIDESISIKTITEHTEHTNEVTVNDVIKDQKLNDNQQTEKLNDNQQTEKFDNKQETEKLEVIESKVLEHTDDTVKHQVNDHQHSIEPQIEDNIKRDPSLSFGFNYEQIEAITEFLRLKIKHRPRVGIICGSGLGGLADQLKEQLHVPYEEIPNFPVSTVSGHNGSLVFGTLENVPVVCMKGRFHPYEGYPLWKCSMPVRVMKLLGIETLIVTNAAGGLNPSFKAGDVMIIKDHINFPGFTGDSPLRGYNDNRWGPRFPAMNKAYDPNLINIVKKCASNLNMNDFIREGVYIMIGGPTFETIAEVKCLKILGADAVGMSTVHEVIVAHHCGLKVIGFSLITNCCISDYNSKDVATHEEVLETGKLRAKDLEKLVRNVIMEL